MRNYRLLISKSLRPYYDNPTPEETAATEAAAAKAAADAAAAAAAKTFTQDEVNALMAKEKGRHQQTVQTQVRELEGLKKSAGLTTKEKDDLQKRITELQESIMTKEELARKEESRLKKLHKEEKEIVEKDRDDWKNRYTRERIERDILNAAKTAGGFNEEQFVDLLAPATRLVEAFDAEGKSTGEWIPTIKFKDHDKDGKPITLDLSVNDAVKRMKELDTFANLFKSGATGGIGGNRDQSRRGTGKDPAKMTPEEYRKFRTEQGLGPKKRA